MLPANVENTVTNRVFQLGYGQYAGESNEVFVYASGSSNALKWPDTNYPLVRGQRYRFSIWATTLPGQNGPRAQFGLRNLTTNEGSFFIDVNEAWTINYKLGWWGAETWETASDHGSHFGSPTTILSYMGYSPNTEGTIYYRTGLVNGYVPNGDIFRGSGIPSNHHGHITTWTYTNDALQVETH